MGEVLFAHGFVVQVWVSRRTFSLLCYQLENSKKYSTFGMSILLHFGPLLAKSVLQYPQNGNRLVKRLCVHCRRSTEENRLTS